MPGRDTKILKREFEIDLIYRQAHTPSGSALLTVDELEELASFARAMNTMVHTVEGYVIRDEAEVAAPEYSLYGPDDYSEKLNWIAQMNLAYGYVLSLVQGARSSKFPVKFKVWLADQDK